MAGLGGVGGWALLALCLASLHVAGAGWVPPWDPRRHPEAAGVWEKTLEVLWNQTRDKVGFCLGGNQAKVLELMGLSFPWPLPTGPGGDALCSNRTRIDSLLCGPQELEEYYKYMLLTTNVEKIPNTPQCAAGASSLACAPGFFDANPENRVRPLAPPKPHACCEGYFCPTMLTCMIPCPLGAFCPRAWAAPPPPEYKARGGEDDSAWCAPYAYKERRPEGCGGADRWSVIPEGAFPAAWWAAGTGNIYCAGGQFCPNTTATLPCPEGYFCRQGSTEPDRCPPGIRCLPSTEVPDNAQTGVTVDALLFLCLGLLWQCSKWYNKALRKLGARERLRVSWGRQPEITIVAAAAPAHHPPSPLPPADQLELEAEALATGGSSAAENGAAGGGAEGVGGAEGSALSEDGDSEQLGKGGQRPLSSVLRALSPLCNRSDKQLASKAAGPVWAAFRGPEALEGGYEALPAEPGEAGSELVPTQACRWRRLRSRGPAHRRTVSSTSEPGEEPTTPRSLHRRLLSPERLARFAGPLGGDGHLPGAAAAGRARLQLSVEFRGLGLRLRSCGKVVLQGVTGQLHGARTTAIMGPSGAGKTSLLNTLSGKAPYGIQTGLVLVNGRPDRLERFKAVTGFVPQDDIMHSTLSVEENLMYAARYRLPAHYSRPQHLYFVERAIQTLQLEDVRHELIGNEETRGISGGQRKRVNVGLELVADPALLFLDEPTTGLDSTASKMLVAALQAVVRAGVTAAAVVHQPSYEAFAMFDDLLLMGKGGRTVYYGPQAGVQAYFEGLGFVLPPRMNPADVFLDIVSGAILRPGQDQADVAGLFEAWEEHCGRGKPAAALPAATQWAEGEGEGEEQLLQCDGDGATAAAAPPSGWWTKAKEAPPLLAAFLVSSAYELWEAGVELCCQVDASLLGGRLSRRRAGGRGNGWQKQVDDECEEEEARAVRRLARRRTPGFLPQFWWCISRAILKRVREPLQVFTDYAIVALTGMTLGLISDRGRSTIMHFAVSVTYSTIALGMISMVGALPTFSKDRTVFFREAASGLNRLSYFIALDTFDHAGTLLRSAVYLIMWYSFAAPRAVIWQMYLVTLGIAYYCSGTAYLLSQLMEPSAAQLAAAVITLIFTLIARESDPHGLIKLIKELSFARYGLEGYVISESNRLTGVWLLARCADLQGLHYDVRRFGWCLLALFSLGMAARLLAILCMMLLHRDKQR